MGSIMEKLKLLLNTKAEIKKAIIEMGQQVGNVFSEYPDKIRAIQSSLNTDDATATASDIAYPKTAYAKGQKIVGDVYVVNTGNGIVSMVTEEVREDGGRVHIKCSRSGNVLLRDKAYIESAAALSYFGNATSSDVAYGKTFTSESGYKIRGNVSSLPASVFMNIPFYSMSSSSSYLNLVGRFETDNFCYKNSHIEISTPLLNFGNAVASDVAAGKTFTSSAGVKIIGTGSSSTTPTNKVSVQIINNASRVFTVYYGSDYLVSIPGETETIEVELNGYITIYYEGASGQSSYSKINHIHSVWDRNWNQYHMELNRVTGDNAYIRFIS